MRLRIIEQTIFTSIHNYLLTNIHILLTMATTTRLQQDCNSAFPFFRLPAELRNEIFRLAYHSDDDYAVQSTRRLVRLPKCPLGKCQDASDLEINGVFVWGADRVIVNKQYLVEALPVLVGRNRFRFDSDETLRAFSATKLIAANLVSLCCTYDGCYSNRTTFADALSALPALQVLLVRIVVPLCDPGTSIFSGPLSCIAATEPFYEALPDLKKLRGLKELVVEPDFWAWEDEAIEREIEALQRLAILPARMSRDVALQDHGGI